MNGLKIEECFSSWPPASRCAAARNLCQLVGSGRKKLEVVKPHTNCYQLRSVWVDDTFILYTEPERLPTRFRILCNLVPIKNPLPPDRVNESDQILPDPTEKGGNNQNPWSPEDFGHFFDGILLNLGDIKPFNMVIPLHRRLGSSWNADTLPGCLGPRYLPWNQGGGCV